MEFDKESLLEKIYEMQMEKLDEKIKEKLKDLNLEKVNIEKENVISNKEYKVLSLSLAHLSAVRLHPVDNVANCGFCCKGLTKFSCKACANHTQFFLA